METKRNLKYFTSKGITPMGIVALALIAVGVGAPMFKRWRVSNETPRQRLPAGRENRGLGRASADGREGPF